MFLFFVTFAGTQSGVSLVMNEKNLFKNLIEKKNSEFDATRKIFNKETHHTTKGKGEKKTV